MKIPTCSKVSHCFLVDHLALESASPPGLFRARFGFHGMNADWFLETSFFSPILYMGRGGGGSPFSQKLLLITFQDFGTTLSWDISHSAESRAEFFQEIFPYPLPCFWESLLVKTLHLGGICTRLSLTGLRGTSISGSTPHFLHRCLLVLGNLSGFPAL